ncbi:hypothetical protein B296_00004215 [Ensete ventricosum]|uniref:Uncharacterized protein n=1 Tax=Ensete ventricosum TaxID=4639 RepID=A0A426Z6H3_ENSVE|nr:hypothetical protein B296_00004215 [Ensete ventricosum]
MSFHGFFILMGRLIFHDAKDEGSFETHAPYLRDAFDSECMTIQHMRLCPVRDMIMRRCKITDSRVMGLATPWYRRGGTSVESLIPCSHRGRALVVKEAEEVENAKANSRYQDRAKGQKPMNFIRSVSMDFSSR